MKKSISLRALAALAFGAALTMEAGAAERTGRFVFDVKVEATMTGQSGKNHATMTSSETLHAAVTLQTDGVPSSVNVADTAANAGKAQVSLDAAAARQPSQAKQMQMQAQWQQTAAACKGNQKCLMDLANQVAAATASWNAGGDQGDGEDRYLNYIGYQGCDSEYSATITRRTEGAYADVQGMVPYTIRETANYTAAAADRALLCHRYTNFVVDAKTGRIFTQELGWLPIKGKRIRTEASRPARESDLHEMRILDEAMRWVAATLHAAAPSGSEQRTWNFKPTDVGDVISGDLQGKVTVHLTWRFEKR